MSDPEVPVRDLLNAQTGRLSWPELARHFARGVVVCVGREQDLIDVAQIMVENRASEIERLYKSGGVHRAMDEDAMRWENQRTSFWAVVVAPWVLVQECEPETETETGYNTAREDGQ
jgi:hypothetical protein